MTAHIPPRMTLDRVVAKNISELRKARIEEATNAKTKRMWTATAVAKRLTELIGRNYSRSTVDDLEGRRDRQIRWVELAALCEIFDVALWDLVLPPEGVQVNTVVTAGAVTGVDLPAKPLEPVEKLVNVGEPDEKWVKFVDPDLATDDQRGIIRYDWPQRDELSWRFFYLPAKNLQAPRQYWEKESEKRELEFHSALGKALRVFRQELQTEE